jgi:AraC-like DNA-binding protein
MGKNPLKTDIFLGCEGMERESGATIRDTALTRCPDILAFHASLNRYFRRDHDFAGEMHAFYELVFVISGTVIVTAGEEVYTLGAGQMILHPPEEFHRIRSEGSNEPHVLNLSFFAASMPFWNSRVMQPSPEEGEELQKICTLVQTGLRFSDRNDLNTARLRLELWMLQMGEHSSTEVAPSDSASALRYAEIVNLLRDHLGESLTACDIAALCNMSLSSLKKIFTRYAGMGVVSFFVEMKMRQAVILLKSGKLGAYPLTKKVHPLLHFNNNLGVCLTVGQVDTVNKHVRIKWCVFISQLISDCTHNAVGNTFNRVRSELCTAG